MKKNAEKPGAAPSLGSKRNCPKCKTKFYDFQKSPILCPKCGAEVNPDQILASILKAAPETKKAPVIARELEDSSEETVVSDPNFESLEELESEDEEELVEGVKDEGSDSDY